MLPAPNARALRRQLAGNIHRPAYHFTPPANWMNDPNGIIEWQGRFHLFYQYNPHGAIWGTIHWGHAVSDDLIHWEDLPIALAPTPGGPDERGCFSGCAVDNEGVPTIVYTGVRGEYFEVQAQCLATSREELLTWEKDPANPVLSDIPAAACPTCDFRDPFVWREGDTWYMALASRVVGSGGAVFLYRSPDLRTWEYLRPLLIGTAASTGDVWECPNFFPLGDKWVLIVGGKGRDFPFTTFYFIGDYADGRFTPEMEGVMDHGYFYAPLAMRDSRGRRLLFGWLREGRSVEAHAAAGWAGAHAIPRELSLRDGVLSMEPIPELEILRGEPVQVGARHLDGNETRLDVSGRALDIVGRFEPAVDVGLAVACTPDASEETRIAYDPERQELIVDRSRSSRLDEVEMFPHRAPHALAAGETLELRILLDGSVLEVIANDRTSISARIYPSREDSQGVKVFGRGKLDAMTVWPMASIWPG
jgi:beta-fructofuranosidase